MKHIFLTKILNLNFFEENITLALVNVHKINNCISDNSQVLMKAKHKAENGLQSRSSKNGTTAVWHYGLKLQ